MAKFNGTVENIEDNRNKVTVIGEYPNDTEYPSAKAVKDYVDDNTDGFLAVDGSNNMLGDLNMGGNAINSASGVVITEEPTGFNEKAVGNILYNDRRYLLQSAKVTSISSSSTDAQIPSAKAVYSAIQEALYVDTDTVIIPAEV